MRRVQVTLHLEDGRWWAEAGEVPQFTAVADSLDELRGLTHEGLAFFLDEEEIELSETVSIEQTHDMSYFQRLTAPRAWYAEQVSTTVAFSTVPAGARAPVRELNPA